MHVPLLFSTEDISSLAIAFLKAVMLPPEITRFCVAVFFNVDASFNNSANQPNQTRLCCVYAQIRLANTRNTQALELSQTIQNHYGKFKCLSTLLP